MATRRDAREWALQIVFSLDLNTRKDLVAVFRHFFADNPTDDAAMRALAESLVQGVVEQRSVIDEAIERYAEHWRMARMGVVDRNVLRIAVYEMMFRPDVPAAVVINEAIDIAKYFSNSESGRFVNGILDRARKELEQERNGQGKTENSQRPSRKHG
ncbi:MAG TPA: transcription antitermination factor NusB [Verrucomicrobia bacterium]|nr:transcription antitermination factor NusB [Verrucomicrobiota bacterium]